MRTSGPEIGLNFNWSLPFGLVSAFYTRKLISSHLISFPVLFGIMLCIYICICMSLCLSVCVSVWLAKKWNFSMWVASSTLLRMDQRLENQQINEKFDRVAKAKDSKENQQTSVIFPHLCKAIRNIEWILAQSKDENEGERHRSLKMKFKRWKSFNLLVFNTQSVEFTQKHTHKHTHQFTRLHV